MSKAPYMPLAKFDALQIALNSIHHGAIKAISTEANEATKKEGLNEVLKGLSETNKELIKFLQDVDKRLYKIEP